MYEAEILEKFSNAIVFSLSDLNQVVSSRGYAKKLVCRMVNRGKVNRIKKGTYSVHDDPFLIASSLLKPSYVSGVSALSFHSKITQVPRNVSCFTIKPPRSYFFKVKINFYHTKHFFGFEMEKYDNFKIPIATPEKAIIDSIGRIPVSSLEGAFEGIDAGKLVSYAKKTGKKSTMKRIGYLLEENGYQAFEELKEFIDKKYIPLDPLVKGREKNKKWKVII